MVTKKTPVTPVECVLFNIAGYKKNSGFCPVTKITLVFGLGYKKNSGFQGVAPKKTPVFGLGYKKYSGFWGWLQKKLWFFRGRYQKLLRFYVNGQTRKVRVLVAFTDACELGPPFGFRCCEVVLLRYVRDVVAQVSCDKAIDVRAVMVTDFVDFSVRECQQYHFKKSLKLFV